MAGNGGKRPGAGRKAGTKATHTYQAEEAKKTLISLVVKEIGPITKAIIKRAKKGDVQAFKELADRIWGKAAQSIDLSTLGKPIVPTEISRSMVDRALKAYLNGKGQNDSKNTD